MAKLYTSFDFRNSLRALVLTNDFVGAQDFFEDELIRQLLQSGLPISNGAKAVAIVGQEIFGVDVADCLIRSCINLTHGHIKL